MDELRQLIAGNWKMNGLRADGVALAKTLAARAKGKGQLAADILVCPPHTLLSDVGSAIAGSPIMLGAQDCSDREPGAFTGDIAARMLDDAGCRFVIVGHSERRHGHGESDGLVRRKAAAVHKAGMCAIVCVGETEAERNEGRAFEVIASQVQHSVPEGSDDTNTVIAYEPVWAIGTGKTPTPIDIDAAHRRIRTALATAEHGAAIRILYGGSVKAANAAEILGIPEVQGALVGGASLKADEFWANVESCP